MSEVENQEEGLFDVHAIFNSRIEKNVEREPVDEPPVKEVKFSKEPHKDPVEEDEEEDEIDPKDSVKAKEVDYKAELEKLQKTAKDTQRSFHEDRKKLAAYKKAVEKLKEEGTLLEEEANTLLDHTKYESEPVEETDYARYCKVWDKELEYMRKYAPNQSDIDQQVLAFQHFMHTATRQEIDDALNDLSEYKDDEVEFTKQMLEIGRQYNDDIYSDIHEAGGIRNLKSRFSEKEEKLQKEVDKLQKQVNKLKQKYEDYDTEPANYKLPTGTASANIQKDAEFDVSKIFASRFKH